MSSDPRPQPTAVLIRRLRRVAGWLERQVDLTDVEREESELASMRARANTCWQAAGRLADLDRDARQGEASDG